MTELLSELPPVVVVLLLGVLALGIWLWEQRKKDEREAALRDLAARSDLRARGLLVRRREAWRRLLPAAHQLARTASGDAWARAAQAQPAQWRQAIERAGLTGDEAIRAANASPGLLL
jgi:hypothetical protein